MCIHVMNIVQDICDKKYLLESFMQQCLQRFKKIIGAKYWKTKFCILRQMLLALRLGTQLL